MPMGRMDHDPRGAAAHNRPMSPRPALPAVRRPPPALRADLLARPALQARLAQAVLGTRVTLLQAGAGWGKTLALTQALAAAGPGPTAWLTLDEDDDAARWLESLGHALSPLELSWQVAPAALPTLLDGPRGLARAIDAVIHALAGSGAVPGRLVFDDLHRVIDSAVLAGIERLVERLPPHWTVAITSRTEPALPLPRWRARGELAEFRQADLAFDEADTEGLLRAHGLSAQAAPALCRRSGGWPAGLRLLVAAGPRALARGDAAGPQAERHVFDYLASEVFERMPVGLQQFLLRCSVLPELTLERCAGVSRLPDAAHWFDEVDRQGLFVQALGGTPPALRLHDLFREFLQQRLQHSGEEALSLRRAAETEPDLQRAIGWLVRAGDYGAACARLVDRTAPAADLERALALFPQAQRDTRPELLMLRGQMAFRGFEFERAERLLAEAAAGWSAVGDDVRARLASAWRHGAQRNTGDFEQAATGLRALVAHRPQGELGVMAHYFAAWEAYAEWRPAELAAPLAEMVRLLDDGAPLTVWKQVAYTSLFVGLPGTDAALERFAAGAAARVEGEAGALRATVLHQRCAQAILSGRFAEAAQWLGSADDDLQWLGSPRGLLTENLLLHLLLDAARADGPAFDHHLRLLQSDMADSSPAHQRVHRMAVVLLELRGLWVLQRHEALRERARELAALPEQGLWPLAQAGRSLAMGLLALVDGDAESAASLLAPRHHAVEDSAFGRGALARLLRAEALRRLGRLDEAAQALRPWLAEARRSGRLGVAALAGAPVVRALAQADWGERLEPWERDRLEAATRLLPQPSGTAPLAATSIGGGLSEREWQVLQALARGESNKLIARRYDLSPFTVKRHVSNIFDKLELSSRAQAAAWLAAHRGAGATGP